MVTLAFVGGLFFIVLLLLILWIVGLAFIVLHPRFNRPRTNENPATTPTATAKPSGTPVVDIELAHRQQQLTGRILKTSSCIVVDYGGVIEGETSPSFVRTTTNEELVADFGDGDDGNVFPVEQSACAICLVDYEHGDRIQRNSPDTAEYCCNHIFHQSCISDWLNRGRLECPCCRCAFTLPVTRVAIDP